jgi:hypothetical protein
MLCLHGGLPDGIHIFKPKIQIWVNFVGFATEDVGIVFVHLEDFMAVWYIFSFWYIFPVLVDFFHFGMF